MAYPIDLTRTVVLRARRDTIVLLVAVTAATFALSSTIHSRPAANLQIPSPPQHWTGSLADVPPAELVALSGEPLTSASLVVPSSELKLPQVPLRALVKLRGCDGEICDPKTNVPTPVRRPASSVVVAHRSAPHHAKPTLMSRLNPLNHLPDMSKISRPFAVAGDTVSGWFRRF